MQPSSIPHLTPEQQHEKTLLMHRLPRRLRRRFCASLEILECVELFFFSTSHEYTSILALVDPDYSHQGHLRILAVLPLALRNFQGTSGPCYLVLDSL